MSHAPTAPPVHVHSGTTNRLDTARQAPPASLERMLQINVAVLVVLGTSLLAMGQQNLLYALAAVVVSASAVILCDIKGRIQLGPDATTLAAVLSCVVLVVQVIRNVEQSHLLNVANVLIYLETILLFQKKEDRSYWSLMVLSFLQVIVAAALNLGLMFGILLAIYVITAFAALMLFYMVRETRPFLQAATGNSHPSNRQGDDPSNRRRPFLGTLSLDASRQMLNRPLVLRLVRMTTVTACGAAIAFFAVPRFNSTPWQSPDQDQVSTVGFTEEVSLDDIGRILESPEQVMRVDFSNLDGSPYFVDGEPYFRGTVLSSYNQAKKVWSQRPGHRIDFSRNRNLDLSSIVVQQIILQPGSHSSLFHVSPCHFIDGTPNKLKINFRTGQLSLDDDDFNTQGTFRYRLGTSAFRNGWQRDMIVSRTYNHVNHDTETVRNNFPELTAVADQIIASQGLQQASAFDRAKALEGHFHRSGLYRYSLESSPDRNRSVDPIEDFISNHRSGHCEYFAGALVMMLKSQNINAHMVVGYKGGDYNTVGNFYIVRQLHAHAWVEAILAPAEIPADDQAELGIAREEPDEFDEENIEEPEEKEDLRPSVWLTLDPTPGSADVNLEQDRLAVITRVREFVDYCQILWDDYVLGLNAMRQEQAIYGPIRRNLRALGRTLFGTDAWQQRWQAIVATYQRLAQRKILGVPATLLLLVAFAAVGSTLIRFRKRLWERGSRWFRSRRSKRGDTTSLHWGPYDNLVSVLHVLGIDRQPYETPNEFAVNARLRLAASDALHPWADLPTQITNVYCHLRYGQAPITDELARPFQQPLAELRERIAAGNLG
ncbi:MAG: DUF3488 domain-containing protein [Planctomycetales bacterium]|nr:DUF3488 domain-containing protein [Planctomycetales bacterium]